MKYKVIERANPQDRSQTKWYATPVNDGRVSISELKNDIAALSSLSKGDVSNVIESLIEVMPKYLLMGKSVKLGELGSLRLTFSSKGADSPEAFNATNISGARVLFIPSVALKKAIEGVSFEKTQA
jgi:predicted histone-like DNA-binding protein